MGKNSLWIHNISIIHIKHICKARDFFSNHQRLQQFILIQGLEVLMLENVILKNCDVSWFPKQLHFLFKLLHRLFKIGTLDDIKCSCSNIHATIRLTDKSHHYQLFLEGTIEMCNLRCGRSTKELHSSDRSLNFVSSSGFGTRDRTCSGTPGWSEVLLGSLSLKVLQDNKKKKKKTFHGTREEIKEEKLRFFLVSDPVVCPVKSSG